jgi:hypothetical protein
LTLAKGLLVKVLVVLLLLVSACSPGLGQTLLQEGRLLVKVLAVLLLGLGQTLLQEPVRVRVQVQVQMHVTKRWAKLEFYL